MNDVSIDLIVDTVMRVKVLQQDLDRDRDPAIRLFLLPHKGNHCFGVYHPQRGFHDTMVRFSDEKLAKQMIESQFSEFVIDESPPNALDDFEGIEEPPTFYKRGN